MARGSGKIWIMMEFITNTVALVGLFLLFVTVTSSPVKVSR